MDPLKGGESQLTNQKPRQPGTASPYGVGFAVEAPVQGAERLLPARRGVAQKDLVYLLFRSGEEGVSGQAQAVELQQRGGKGVLSQQRVRLVQEVFSHDVGTRGRGSDRVIEAVQVADVRYPSLDASDAPGRGGFPAQFQRLPS